MSRAIKIYFKLILVQIRSQMEYRISFWMELISTAILDGSYFLALALILERFGNIAGWTLGEIAFIAGLAEMGFALMDLFFSGFDPSIFSELVRLGKFDQLLLRPVNISLQVLGSRFLLRRLGRFLEGLVILVIGLSLAQIHWTIGKVLYLPVVLVSIVVGMGALFMAGATLIFWTVQPVEVVNVVTYGGNELMSYPMTIYPRWIQRIFTYIFPLIFLNYLPALYFLDKPGFLNFPHFTSFLAPAAAAVMIFAAFQFWKFGLKHYQSTGT